MSTGPRVRLATEADAPGLLAIYGPVVRDTAISFELDPPSLEEMRNRVRTTLEHWPWLVAEDVPTVRSAPSLLGYAYAGPFRARPAYRWTVETTVYVHAECQRRGVGIALYTALLDILRAAGYRSVVGGITLPNPPSVALHERLGFRHVGTFASAGFKLGSWRDVGFWQVDLRGDEPPPSPPRPLSSLVTTPEWHTALCTGERHLRGKAAAGPPRLPEKPEPGA
jgi:phosphinothricin acetyltransferase